MKTDTYLADFVASDRSAALELVGNAVVRALEALNHLIDVIRDSTRDLADVLVRVVGDHHLRAPFDCTAADDSATRLDPKSVHYVVPKLADLPRRQAGGFVALKSMDSYRRKLPHEVGPAPYKALQSVGDRLLHARPAEQLREGALEACCMPNDAPDCVSYGVEFLFVCVKHGADSDCDSR